MIALASEIAIGDFAPTEPALQPLKGAAWREREQGWLYMHLDTARRCRLRMNALALGPEYVAAFRERELALIEAGRHYLNLRNEGAPPDALLDQMMIAEDLPR